MRCLNPKQLNLIFENMPKILKFNLDLIVLDFIQHPRRVVDRLVLSCGLGVVDIRESVAICSSNNFIFW